MALSRRWVRPVAAWLGLMGLVGACRSNNICRSEDCLAPLLGAGGTTTTGGDGFVGKSGDASMAAGEGGAAGDRGAAGGAADEALPPLTCDPNMADCDGSRLTGCESDLTWTIRHCGACGQICDGLCVGGRCEPTVLIQDTYAVRMVATNTTGFALVTDMFSYSLVMVDFKTASSDVLMSRIAADTTLAASADRVYVLDNTNHELQSARLDGADLKKEDVEWPQSIGGTAKGSYYVNVHTSPLTEGAPSEDSYQLYYRPASSQAWQLLRESADSFEILSSSPFGLVLATYSREDSESLSLWDGSEELALGEAPPGLVEAAAVDGGSVALLTHDDTSGVWELWWMKPGEETTRYEVPEPSNGTTGQLIVQQDSVVLYVLRDDGKAFLQAFGRYGARSSLPRLGLLPAANVVWVNATHIYYGVYDNWVMARFLRSAWYDVKF